MEDSNSLKVIKKDKLKLKAKFYIYRCLEVFWQVKFMGICIYFFIVGLAPFENKFGSDAYTILLIEMLVLKAVIIIFRKIRNKMRTKFGELVYFQFEKSLMENQFTYKFLRFFLIVFEVAASILLVANNLNIKYPLV